MSWVDHLNERLDVIDKSINDGFKALNARLDSLTWDRAAEPGPAENKEVFHNGISEPDNLGRVRLQGQAELDNKYAQYPSCKAIAHLHYVPFTSSNWPVTADVASRISVNCSGADMPGTFNRAFHYPNAPHTWERGDTLTGTISFHESTIEQVLARLEGFYIAASQQTSTGGTQFSPGGY